MLIERANKKCQLIDPPLITLLERERRERRDKEMEDDKEKEKAKSIRWSVPSDIPLLHTEHLMMSTWWCLRWALPSVSLFFLECSLCISLPVFWNLSLFFRRHQSPPLSMSRTSSVFSIHMVFTSDISSLFFDKRCSLLSLSFFLRR